jgi:hypothetical protein
LIESDFPGAVGKVLQSSSAKYIDDAPGYAVRRDHLRTPIDALLDPAWPHLDLAATDVTDDL